MFNPSIGAVILAAGKGTRLKTTDTPKVMLPIGGKPIVSYIVETLESAGFTPDKIVLVVGFHHEKVRDYFGARVTYALQKEQKGTAHAAYTGMLALLPGVTTALVMGGDDSAFYLKESLENFIEVHLKEKNAISLLSVEVDDPSQLGRVVRDQSTVEIIEKEDLTEEQKAIHEVSTGTYCFDRAWFTRVFPQMLPLQSTGEYGLNVSLKMAREEGVRYQIIPLARKEEWFGVNAPEELTEADRRKQLTIDS